MPSPLALPQSLCVRVPADLTAQRYGVMEAHADAIAQYQAAAAAAAAAASGGGGGSGAGAGLEGGMPLHPDQLAMLQSGGGYMHHDALAMRHALAQQLGLPHLMYSESAGTAQSHMMAMQQAAAEAGMHMPHAMHANPAGGEGGMPGGDHDAGMGDMPDLMGSGATGLEGLQHHPVFAAMHWQQQQQQQQQHQLHGGYGAGGGGGGGGGIGFPPLRSSLPFIPPLRPSAGAGGPHATQHTEPGDGAEDGGGEPISHGAGDAEAEFGGQHDVVGGFPVPGGAPPVGSGVGEDGDGAAAEAL